jgi:hypothetical protein
MRRKVNLTLLSGHVVEWKQFAEEEKTVMRHWHNEMTLAITDKTFF